MTQSPTFVHLRLHSEYSVVDSLIRIKPLIKEVINLGMPAVALTDHVNLFGLIKFYNSAHSDGVKPIFGADLLVAPDDNPNNFSVLPILVLDYHGYLNLMELLSRAYLEGQHRGNAVLLQSWLEGHTQGLIALSGAVHGEIGKALLADATDHAEKLLQQYEVLFPQRFYLELQRTGRPGDDVHVIKAAALAEKHQVPVVATNDVRFIYQDEFEAHEARVCINDRRTLNDPRRPRLYSDQQYLRSPQEMQELFADIPEALANSVAIAMRCNLMLELGKPYLPSYPIPEGMTIDEYLIQVSEKGLEKRLWELFDNNKPDFAKIREIYLKRLHFELEIITQMGFPGYFLIVMEFIQWAKDNDIPVGPGRGSGAGSLVAYVLKITDLDPLAYDLLFERFLNPERVSMPDFDVDFCMDGRDRVIEHVADLYGKQAVSQIITFGTMAAKAVIRDVGRVQGKPYSLGDRLSKLVPFEIGITLEKAIEQEESLRDFLEANEEAQEIMEMALKLEGLVRNVGKHAGGVVIAPTKLSDFSPLYCDDTGSNLVTQYDKNDVESAGLVKFDFLGLRTLTIIDWAIKSINADQHNKPIDLAKLSMNDAAVFAMLERGETTAVFQLESRGMKDLMKRLRPSNFEDIIALVALFRPGPLGSGMVDDFIDRKHGRKQVSYPHPDLESVLKNTYGVILYQEQVMQIAQVLANYSLGGADMLRRAMGKKKPAEMQKQRAIFQDGASKNNIPVSLAMQIFDLMEKFADYGFNKSHSAAYALVSYQTAYLKHYYPAHFMSAVLTADMQNTDKIVVLIEECRRMKIVIKQPDINSGSFHFRADEQGKILYGLGAVKGLGESPINNLVKARENGGDFLDLFDLCRRIDSSQTNRRCLEALIKSGACDCLGEDRALLLACLPIAMQTAQQESSKAQSGVGDLFGEILSTQETHGDIYRDFRHIRPYSSRQRLQEEKETLGLFLTGHPIAEFLPELNKITGHQISDLKPDRTPQLVAGLIHEIRMIRSKRGDQIAVLTLDDRSSRIEASLFGDLVQECRDLLIKDSIVVVEGIVSMDEYNGTNSTQLRVRKLYTLEKARSQFARQLELRLAADFDITLLTRLKHLLEEHQVTLQSDTVSECQLSIQVSLDSSQGILDWPQQKITPSDHLLQNLTELLGQHSVNLRY